MPEKHIPWLHHDQLDFPDVSEAWTEPNGILAAGGDLSTTRLVEAYCRGIFPWYNEDEPILWWSPDPRCVLIPTDIKVSKSLKKLIRKQTFTVSFDTCFEQVISACAAPRQEDATTDPGTWISDEMMQAYLRLHNAGYAHSVECWSEGELVGGLYGLAIGKVFFGESMFSRVSNASKVAFTVMCRKLDEMGFELIDGQVYSPHLETLGFKLIPRSDFVKRLMILTEPREKTVFNK